MEQHGIRFTPQPSPAQPIPIGALANGEEIGSTAHHLLRNGKPWYPVMGEFHYSRYPAEEWETELRKMKAAGIMAVATYVFWIHHEEEKGVWRTDGQRNLRHFLELCQKTGLEVMLRIGPWAHGECRNGGFPDWLQHDASITPRTDDPAYLMLVKEFYARIYEQAQGLMYKDGGPIIGIQIENEHGHCGGVSGGTGLEHMRTLKRLAQEAGFLAPIYTATGWGGGNVVAGEMLPVMGNYADAPWDPSLMPLPASPNYLMLPAPNDPIVGSDWGYEGEHFTYPVDDYPYLTAELGGGLQCTFHRRPLLSAADTAAQAMVKLATGANLLGYYMFHGGTHPAGKLTTLQESKSSGSYTDVPLCSYDFQAPLGEFGRLHESCYALKNLHYLIADAGESLAASMCYFPAQPVTDAENMTDLRWCVRYDAVNEEGFLLINNHQRLRAMAAHQDVRFAIDAGNKHFDLPALKIPADAYGAIPFHLRCGHHRLLTTNALLLCRLGDLPVLYTMDGSQPIATFDGDEGRFIALTQEEALHAWKAGESLYIADGILFEEADALTLISDQPRQTIRRLPDEKRCMVETAPVSVSAGYEQTAAAPEYTAYRVTLGSIPADQVEDVYLRLDYEGDHAEIYLHGELIADDYATGQPWQVALKRFGWPGELEVRVYPVTRPTYFEIPVPQGMALHGVSTSAAYRFRIGQEDFR